jgi:hypothetical protein
VIKNEDSKKLRGRLEKDNDDSPHLDRDTRYSLSHFGWSVALGMAAFDSSDRAPEPINFFCRVGGVLGGSGSHPYPLLSIGYGP